MLDREFMKTLTPEERVLYVRMMFEKMIEEHGWAMHAVGAPDGLHANHNTEGLFRNYGHLNFQVTLNIQPEVVQGIIRTAAELVKEGFKFEDGKRYDNIIRGFDVLMKEFPEKDRRVLRIILPDPKGKLPGEEGCEEFYMSQLDDFEFVGRFDVDHKRENVQD